ncbi:helix-turn-helix domain-containing protein [Rhodovulum steppense]|uniref:helix-turn-helix domain-containing protein n=1 Tax=Rhodovulum steppense TaxID=540251 RepID=UPI00140532E1|nr:helix-turn-helix domain-containing protein [Rhodovulum steppense]
MAAFRATLEDMRPRDAVDHAVHVFAELTGQASATVGVWPDRHLPGMERALFCLLYRREGRIVSGEALRAALWPDRDDGGSDNGLRVLAHYLKKRMRGVAVIECVIGEGYRLVRAPGTLFPWETDL